jgi:endogenous inhibitor of DNA gyrase (YacG/DUF329 family)
MINVECPNCKKSKEIKSTKDMPHFPFCCKRCKDGDVAKWILGEYSIEAQESGIITEDD